jgi:hypothetical protein
MESMPKSGLKEEPSMRQRRRDYVSKKKMKDSKSLRLLKNKNSLKEAAVVDHPVEEERRSVASRTTKMVKSTTRKMLKKIMSLKWLVLLLPKNLRSWMMFKRQRRKFMRQRKFQNLLTTKSLLRRLHLPKVEINLLQN